MSRCSGAIFLFFLIGCSLDEFDESQFAVDQTSPRPYREAVKVGDGIEDAPVITVPSCSLLPKQVGVVFNSKDSNSKKVAKAYRIAHNIPAANVVGLRLSSSDTLSQAAFETAFADLEKKIPASVEVLALTWTKPYRIGGCGTPDTCTSITSGFGFGPKVNLSSNDPAVVGRQLRDGDNPYFDSDSCAPYTDFGIRPAMLVPGSLSEAKILIKRGTDSVGAFPKGKVFLVTTPDKARSVRNGDFMKSERDWDNHSQVEVEHVDHRWANEVELRDEKDVLIYQTGLAVMKHIGENEFLPGAIGDHLTSYGGRFSKRGKLEGLARWATGKNRPEQTNILAWLNLTKAKAGVTGSYGTVVEPLNYKEKFPAPSVFLKHYVSGSPLVVAYWKSVAYPGQGLFVGDPLARPYGTEARFTEDTGLSVRTTELRSDTAYVIEEATSKDGPYKPIGKLPRRTEAARVFSVPAGELFEAFEFKIKGAKKGLFYRARPADQGSN